jgi:hypothetical protein
VPKPTENAENDRIGNLVLTEALSERVSEVSGCQDGDGETDNLTDLTTPEAEE